MEPNAFQSLTFEASSLEAGFRVQGNLFPPVTDAFPANVQLGLHHNPRRFCSSRVNSYQPQTHSVVNLWSTGYKEGVNGVNRPATIGEKYYRLPTKREKNY